MVLISGCIIHIRQEAKEQFKKIYETKNEEDIYCFSVPCKKSGYLSQDDAVTSGVDLMQAYNPYGQEVPLFIRSLSSSDEEKNMLSSSSSSSGSLSS